MAISQLETYPSTNKIIHMQLTLNIQVKIRAFSIKKSSNQNQNTNRILLQILPFPYVSCHYK